MAIKSRLLSKLKSIYRDMDMAIAAHPKKMCSVINNLEEARTLCRQGMMGDNYAKYSEVYDALIMATKQILSGEAGKDACEIVKLCRELLDHIVTETGREEYFKKEIVFLPYKASMWDSLESVWQAAVNDSEHVVPYVVVIPYCDRTPEGGCREWHCEVADFPQYVPVMDYRKVDLKTMHPDIIVIHNPYDDYNTVTSVDMGYYSRYLKEYTDKLVYIPYFILEEPNWDDEEALEEIAHFIFHGEAVRNANLTIVQSENMREAYIRLLVKYTNKDRAFWEKRILGIGSPKIDKVLSTRREDIPLPESWRRIIEKTDGTRKKVILYNVSLTCLFEYKDILLDKMEWVFRIFREQQDKITLLWRPHPLFEAMIKSRVPEVWERYQKITEHYRNEGWGIYDDSPDLHRAIAVSDGYYGDGSSLCVLFQSIQRQVMIQNINQYSVCGKGMQFNYLAIDGEYGWFATQIAFYSVLCRMNLNNGTVDWATSISYNEKCWMDYGPIGVINGKVIVAPFRSNKSFIKYDIANNSFQEIPLIVEVGKQSLSQITFVCAIKHECSLYFIENSTDRIVEYNGETESFFYHRILDEQVMISDAVLANDKIYLSVVDSVNLLEVSLTDYAVRTFELPIKYNIWGMSYIENKFWFIPTKGNKVCCWEIGQKATQIQLPIKQNIENPFNSVIKYNDDVLLMNENASMAYLMKNDGSSYRECEIWRLDSRLSCTADKVKYKVVEKEQNETIFALETGEEVKRITNDGLQNIRLNINEEQVAKYYLKSTKNSKNMYKEKFRFDVTCFFSYCLNDSNCKSSLINEKKIGKKIVEVLLDG